LQNPPKIDTIVYVYFFCFNLKKMREILFVGFIFENYVMF
jgi:hypothetical protein